jgi:hypothetical protein
MIQQNPVLVKCNDTYDKQLYVITNAAVLFVFEILANGKNVLSCAAQVASEDTSINMRQDVSKFVHLPVETALIERYGCCEAGDNWE